jgi:hypothetical protein
MSPAALKRAVDDWWRILALKEGGGVHAGGSLEKRNGRDPTVPHPSTVFP